MKRRLSKTEEQKTKTGTQFALSTCFAVSLFSQHNRQAPNHCNRSIHTSKIFVTKHLHPHKEPALYDKRTIHAKRAISHIFCKRRCEMNTMKYRAQPLNTRQTETAEAVCDNRVTTQRLVHRIHQCGVKKENEPNGKSCCCL